MNDERFDWHIFRDNYNVPESLQKAVKYALFAVQLYRKAVIPDHPIPQSDIPLTLRAEIRQIVDVVWNSLSVQSTSVYSSGSLRTF
jgi:hypothetical protein